MKLYFSKLMPGLVFLGLVGVMASTSLESTTRILATLALLGAPMGAFANMRFRRFRSLSVNWRNLANGGWLGAAFPPGAVAGAMLGQLAAVDAFFQSGVYGLFVGYGLGLIVSGLGFFAAEPAVVAE